LAPSRADRPAERRPHAKLDQAVRARSAPARAAHREDPCGEGLRDLDTATRHRRDRPDDPPDGGRQPGQLRRPVLTRGRAMSFAAEPYGVFVDDLVSSLTGGVTRERFTFLDENKPFTLAYAPVTVASTVRVNGLVEGAYFRFTPGTDFDAVAGTIVWRESAPG